MTDLLVVRERHDLLGSSRYELPIKITRKKLALTRHQM